ncbi:MAG: hypothetical protein AB7E62_11030 [Methanothrix sp.]|nr:MAG: hypothetical protein METHSR3v1_1900003 [Methanothrix sp.]
MMASLLFYYVNHSREERVAGKLLGFSSARSRCNLARGADLKARDACATDIRKSKK